MNEQEYKLRRREQIFAMIKFLLGTFVLGLTAHLINYRIQQSKIELQVRQQETEFLESFSMQFLQIPETNEAEKLGYLKFMSTITQSDAIRKRYSQLYKYYDSTYKDLEEKKEEYALLMEELNKTDWSMGEDGKEVEMNKPNDEVLEKEKNLIRDETEAGTADLSDKKDFERKEDKSNENRGQPSGKPRTKNATVKHADSLLQQINNTKQALALNSVSQQKSMQQMPSDVLWEDYNWLKEGRFRTYGKNNDIYIGVNQLDDDTEGVVFQLRRSQFRDKDVMATFKLSLTMSHNKKVLYDSGCKYEVVLERIGHAGNNPLNKAAYYSIRCISN